MKVSLKMCLLIDFLKQSEFFIRVQFSSGLKNFVLSVNYPSRKREDFYGLQTNNAFNNIFINQFRFVLVCVRVDS